MVEDFFTERKRWSQDKYRILGSYLETAARILKFIWAVDLFAGPGSFDKGEEGSPLLIVRLAERAQASNRTYKIRGVFVEQELELYENLKRRLSDFPSHLYTAHHGSFTQFLPEILSQTTGRPALYFLDPFGVKGLKWQDFAPLFQRTAPTEILANFNIVHARRLAGFLESEASHREGWLHVLDDVMGDSLWRQAAISEPSGEQRDQLIAREYLQRLINSGGFRFATAYPVMDPATGNLKYFLIYGTRNMKGADRMNDVMYKAFEEAQQRASNYQLVRGIQLSLLETPPTPQQIRDSTIEVLTKDIMEEAGRAGGQLTYEQVRYRLLDRWFGKANSALFRETIKRMIRVRLVDRESETGISDKEVLKFRI